MKTVLSTLLLCAALAAQNVSDAPVSVAAPAPTPTHINLPAGNTATDSNGAIVAPGGGNGGAVVHFKGTATRKPNGDVEIKGSIIKVVNHATAIEITNCDSAELINAKQNATVYLADCDGSKVKMNERGDLTLRECDSTDVSVDKRATPTSVTAHNGSGTIEVPAGCSVQTNGGQHKVVTR